MFQDHHIQDERLIYDKPCNYSPDKTLMGPWVDDRARYVRRIHKHPSSTSCDFPTKPKSYVHPNIIWNHRITAEGHGPRILMDHERTKYHNNFSTTYDLSYNYIPKISKNYQNLHPHGTKVKKELINNFGNVTDYGLLNYMKKKWNTEIIDPDPPMFTEMQVAYQKYKKGDFCTKRFAANRKLSGKMFSVNDYLIHNPTRGNKALVAPDNIVKPIPNYPSCPLKIHVNPCQTKLLHKDYKLKQLIT